MKRWLILLLVTLMAMGTIAAGCSSGETSQAKQDAQKADAAWQDAKKQIDQLGSLLTTAMGSAQAGNFQGFSAEQLKTAQETVVTLATDLQTVKGEYEKIKTLKGVDKYVIYANARIKMIEANLVALQAGAKLLAEIGPVLATGDIAQITAWFQANMTELLNDQKLQQEAQAAQQAADKIKSQNNL